MVLFLLEKRLFIASLLLIVAANCSSETITEALVAAATKRTELNITYDGRYVSIAYPGGDVPNDIGVCTDLIIRSYRAVGADLQQLVHEDMTRDFNAYPSKRIWGLDKTDRNIDHRRVPNLQVFFAKHGQVLAITDDPSDYAAGDLVTWLLPGNLPHIGIVSDRFDPISRNPLIIHNIGAGPKLENRLFDFPITGHYRYRPNAQN